MAGWDKKLASIVIEEKKTIVENIPKSIDLYCTYNEHEVDGSYIHLNIGKETIMFSFESQREAKSVFSSLLNGYDGLNE